MNRGHCAQVAHYLILTHLRESMKDMPLLDALGVGSRKRSAAAAAGDDAAAAGGQPAAKRARTDARDPSQARHVCRAVCIRRLDACLDWAGSPWLPAAVQAGKPPSSHQLVHLGKEALSPLLLQQGEGTGAGSRADVGVCTFACFCWWRRCSSGRRVFCAALLAGRHRPGRQ